jgi:MFS family permease
VLTEQGLSITGGISGSMLMNIGGVAGCLLFGFYARAAGARLLAAAFMVGLFAAASVFGFVPATVTALLAATLAIGFCLYASINAMYAVVPPAFPAIVRGTGTGVAMSVGRLGAVTGPALAGVLMSAGWDRSAYCMALAAPMLLAAASLYWIRAYDLTARPIVAAAGSSSVSAVGG